MCIENAENRRDRYHALSSPYNFGAETHLGGGDTSAYVVPSAAITRSLSSEFSRHQYSAYEGPTKFLTAQV